MNRASLLIAAGLLAATAVAGCASGSSGVDRAEVNRIVGTVLSGQAAADPREKLAALAELEAFLTTTPHHSERLARVLTQLADLYREVETRTHEQALARHTGPGDPPRADHHRSLALYNKVLSDYPERRGNHVIYYQMARSYEAMGEPRLQRHTLEAFLKIVPRGPDATEVRYRLGELAFSDGRFHRAAEHYAEVLKDPAADRQLRDFSAYKRAWALYLAPDYPMAVPAAVAFLDEKQVTFNHRRVLDSQTMPEPDWERVREVNGLLARMLYDQGGVAALRRAIPEDRDYLHMVYAKLGEATATYKNSLAAVPVYEDFLARHPNSAEAPRFIEYMVDRYTESQDLEAAIAARQRLVDRYGPGTGWWDRQDAATRRRFLPVVRETAFKLARHYHSVAQETSQPADYRRATSAYREFIKRFEDSREAPEAAFLLGEVLFDAGDFPAAAEAYARSAYGFTVHQRAAEAAYAAVYAREQALKNLTVDDTAYGPRLHLLVEAFNQLVEKFPREERLPAAYERVAALLFTTRDYVRLYDVSDRVVRFGPRSRKLHAKAWRALGEAALETGRQDQADAAFRQAISYLADNPVELAEVKKLLAANAISMARNGTGDQQTALALLDAAKSLPGDDPLAQSARVDAGLAWLSAGEFGQALAVFQSFITAYPDSEHRDRVALAVLNVGERALEAGQPDTARRAWARYRQWFAGIWPERDMAIARLEGRAHMEAGNLDAADRAYTQSIAIHREHSGQAPEEMIDLLAGIRYKRAVAKSEAGRHRDAADLYEGVADQLPESRVVPNALFAAISAREAAGDATGAVATADRLLHDYPHAPEAAAVQERLGELLLAAKRPVDAGLHYQARAANRPDAEAAGNLLRATEIFEQAGEGPSAAAAMMILRDRSEVGSDPWVAAHREMALLELTGNRSEPKPGSPDAAKLETRLLDDLMPLAEADELDGNGRRMAAEILLARAGQERARYDAVRLVPPLEENLDAKRIALKTAIAAFTEARGLRSRDVSLNATRQIGEMFEAFAEALLNSPPPASLTETQVAIYQKAVAKKARPYQSRAIQTHEENLKRAREGIVNADVEASLAALGRLDPEWYDRPEISMQPVYVP
ncbi:MAG: tetratricopeptide repeat protein [Nitrospirota bacterium]|nr:tetratricopeptide repeat protein [Nitrospirota bacterium]